MIAVPIWAVWVLLTLVFQLLVALLCRRALGSFRLAQQDLSSALQVYLKRSDHIYLVGRVRRAAGARTLWDVMGLCATEAAARKACSGKRDFYLRLQLDEIQDDDSYRAAPLTFPKGKDKDS